MYNSFYYIYIIYVFHLYPPTFLKFDTSYILSKYKGKITILFFSPFNNLFIIVL
nr:MAG TPA: hypothetical protein [Caudoviricetes sp.]